MKFPNETEEYRMARDRLLKAEIALRKDVEEVAAIRRALPLGGAIPEDYVFEVGAEARKIKLSEFFGAFDTMVVYNFMYGPKMARPCPMCSSLLDALNGNARAIAVRTSLVVVARSPIGRILEFAQQRGWSNLRLASSAGNRYNLDYHGEDDKGAQLPMLNVFVRRNGTIRHFSGSEMLTARMGPNQDARHVDMMWPLWNLLDHTPEGRGADWYPPLEQPA